MVGTAEGFSILCFLKPGINSIFGSKQSGVKCALHTYVNHEGSLGVNSVAKHFSVAHLATYDNLYPFLLLVHKGTVQCGILRLMNF